MNLIRHPRGYSVQLELFANMPLDGKGWIEGLRSLSYEATPVDLKGWSPILEQIITVALNPCVYYV